jgi:hypothetical protein
MTIGYPDVSAEATTINAPEDLVLAATAVEFFKWQMRRYHGIETPRDWAAEYDEALAQWASKNANMGPQPSIITRRSYAHGMASA